MAYAGATTPRLITEISQLLADRIIGLNDAAALQLAQRFACHGRAAGPLRDHLLKHRRVLHEPISDLPLTLVHIAYALHDAGHPGIVLPICLDCGIVSRLLRYAVPGGRVCYTCHHLRSKLVCLGCGRLITAASNAVAAAGLCRSCRAQARPVEECAGCGRTVRIKAHQLDGTGLCHTCHHAPVEPCLRCGADAPVYRRTDDGPLCRRCYRPPPTPCTRCGRDRPVHARSADGPVCASCHRRPLRECGRCGAIAVWHSRPRDGQPGYCIACHHRPEQACAACGEVRKVSRSENYDGAWMCDLCRARRMRCDLCGQTARIIARWPIGAACHTCYQRTRRTPHDCPSCGQQRVLIGLDAAGVRICAQCANLDYDYTCQHCGVQGKFPTARTCYDCLAAQTVRNLLTIDSEIPPHVAPMAAALLAVGTGDAVWRWLSPRRGTAALITTIVASGDSVSHDLLDTLPQNHLLHRLRAVLVAGGVLPDRPEFLDRIEPWLEGKLADQPRSNAQLIRTWARWTLLRRARRRLPRRPFTEPAAHYQRSCLTAAIRLLAWLDQQQLTLATVTQADIDRWLTEHPHEYAYLAKEFLRWARNRHLVGEVTITQRPRSHNPATLSEDEHWQHLRRCLHDDTLPTDVRAAGSLVLLYGMTLARISRLRDSDLEADDRGTWLHLGSHRLRIVSQAADLLLALAATPARPRTATLDPGTGWLFPGGQPGRHTAILHKRLARHGLPRAAHGRAAALIHLAADLPAPVLVDLLGISIDTANQWAKHASSDWAAYLNARARSH